MPHSGGMSDLSTAAQSIIDSLASSAAGGFVEEYRIGPQGRMVRRGKPAEQVDAAIKLEAISNRRSTGMFRLAKLRGEQP